VALRFSADWQGKNADPQRETEVRLLWTAETLFLRFGSNYRTITVFPDAELNGWRDELWDRDVAEVFLQPEASNLRRYKEFEVSPNGYWIDLDIGRGEKQDLKSGMRRRVVLDEKGKTWIAELAIPMKCLVREFDSSATWRVNFYRVEGASEPRFYSAWRPTGTPMPNFHVPEAFGELVFAAGPAQRK
jgi:alpha-galactosidase